MKTIRFLQTEQFESEGRNAGPVYIAGDVHEFEDDFADRWIRRGVAELVDAEAEKAERESAAAAAADLAALEKVNADQAAAAQAKAEKPAAKTATKPVKL